ncbi:MAG: D-alanine--D-alanine ligase [Pseudomonadota bacterium]
MSASLHVAVLMGGWSAEREVSLTSGRACAAALERLGHRVSVVDADRALAARLAALKPDVVFNALHGRWGEDGCVQGLLEVLGIAYTHSGVAASAVAMDKPLAKALFAAAGLPLAHGVLVTPRDVYSRDPLPRPYVLKARNEGSSVGVAIIAEGANYPNPIAPDVPGPWRDYDQLLAEEFIPGRELSVAVLDGEALGVLELRPSRGFYDYDAKYTAGVTAHFMPAPIHQEAYAEAMAIAAAAHRALGCRGVSRADLRYDDTGGEPGRLVLLEVNTQPGMTPLSIVPEIAAHAGIGFDALVGRILASSGVAA